MSSPRIDSSSYILAFIMLLRSTVESQSRGTLHDHFIQWIVFPPDVYVSLKVAVVLILTIWCLDNDSIYHDTFSWSSYHSFSY